MQYQRLPYSNVLVKFEKKINLVYHPLCDLDEVVAELGMTVAAKNRDENETKAIQDFEGKDAEPKRNFLGRYIHIGETHHVLIADCPYNRASDFTGCHEEGHVLQSFRKSPRYWSKSISHELSKYPSALLQKEVDAHLWAIIARPDLEIPPNVPGREQAYTIYEKHDLASIQYIHQTNIFIPPTQRLKKD